MYPLPEHAIQNFANRICIIRLGTLLLFMSCSVVLIPTVLAQDGSLPDHPIFSRPIQESEPLPWDVRSLRVHITIDPRSHSIRGEAELDVVMSETAFDSNLVLAGGFADVTTTTVSYQPDSLFQVRGDSIGFSDGTGSPKESDAAPETGAGSGTQTRLFVRVEYTLERALHTSPLGEKNGDWSSVWTSFEPGSSAWIPFQIALDDWFSAELRISLPQGWHAYPTGDQQWNIEDEEFRTVSSVHPDAVSVSSIGFVVLEENEVTLEDSHIVVSGLTADDRSLNEGLISMARMANFYHDSISDVDPDSSRIVLFPGPRNVSSSGSGLTLIPITALPTGLLPADEDYRLAKAMALRWISGNMSLAGWTDVWMFEALSSYMAALYIRDRHGETAYLHVLWNQREDYLAESKKYRRPLVWDRWTHPSELIDAHASGKGLWIFHMLGEAHGTEFVWNALGILAATGESDPVSTEELRSTLEQSLELNLSHYFDQWVYGAGHPVLDHSYSVSSDQESVELSISQLQEGYLIPDAFSFELTVESASLVGMDSDEFIIDTRSSTVILPVALRPQYLLLDPLGLLLFENGSTLDPNTIVSSLRRNESLTARYVGSRRLMSSDVDPSMMIALRPILASQDSPYIDQNLINSISRMAPSTSALRSILSIARDTTARARPHAVEKLAAFQGAEDARRAAFEVANTESNPLMLAAAVTALVQLDSTLAWPVLRSALVTESTGEIVRRRAVTILPGAPVAEKNKIDALLNLLDNRYPDNLRIEVLRSLSTWPDNDRIAERLSQMWSSASGELRAAIIDFLSLTPRPLDDAEWISDWLRHESDPVLYTRLNTALPPDVE